ncbi:MAG: enoyl-CoA hydratase [Actinomycetota bacterium]
MSQFETLDVSVSGEIGALELNRPAQLNALSRQTLQDLTAAARWFDSQRQVKVVVVSGQGRSFCAGFDLNTFSTPDPNYSTRDIADIGRLMAEAIFGMNALTIAAIQGNCIGGGLVLANSCDLRLAEEDSRFVIPEVDLGIPLTWSGIPRLVREIGPAATKELVLTCRPFGADEAKSLGFINTIVPKGTVMTAAQELAEQLASKSAYVLRTTKQQVNAALEEMVHSRDFASDADIFASAVHDPESRAVGERYLQSKKKGNK